MVEEFEKGLRKGTESTNREQEPLKKFKINKLHRRNTTSVGVTN